MKTGLVLLPGLDGTGTLFSEFLPLIESEFEPVVVRYPSDVPLGYAESEAIARRSLPSQGPFLILGESFSGPIAISIAASAPRGLAGLILCASFASCPRPYLARIWPVARHLPIFRIPPTLLGRYFGGRFYTQALSSSLEKARKSVADEVFKARIGAACAVDFSNELRKVRVPVLYLRASQDRIVPRSASRKIRRLVPSLHIEDIEGPHYLLQACAPSAAESIRRFARAVV